jgi:glucan 1,3-beta-glucosidase
MGINHVRIPIGFWALGGLTADEPYVPSLSWTYLLRGIEWARKYGIRVMVELHAAPGSQNGWNHSGRLGAINWINGTDGIANAQRTLPYLQQLATFFSSPDYIHVAPIMGLLNEPAAHLIGVDPVKSWYTEAMNVVRAATGTGEGKGPWAIIHDGMVGLNAWAGFLPKGDRVMLGMSVFLGRYFYLNLYFHLHVSTNLPTTVQFSVNPKLTRPVYSLLFLSHF